MSAEFEAKVLEKFDKMEKHSAEFEEMVLGKFDQLDKKIEGKTDMIMNYLFEMSQTMKGMDKRLKTVESTVKRAGTIMVHSATCGSPQDAL
ncbi:MAG: hypothetical protein IKR47_05870 [Lachnospiraceae bacterium]|nr:hypothetical protein [Lachnospiraceae bacterium]